MAIEASDLCALHHRIFVPAGCTSLTAPHFLHLPPLESPLSLLSPIFVTPEGQFPVFRTAQRIIRRRSVPSHKLLHHIHDGLSSLMEFKFEHTGSRFDSHDLVHYRCTSCYSIFVCISKIVGPVSGLH